MCDWAVAVGTSLAIPNSNIGGWRPLRGDTSSTAQFRAAFASNARQESGRPMTEATSVLTPHLSIDACKPARVVCSRYACSQTNGFDIMK